MGEDGFDYQASFANIALTPERKKQINLELSATGEYFNGFKRNWYLAGGTALELANGELTRDHQDVDVAMFREDLVPFFEYTKASGYSFERPLRTDEFGEYEDTYGRKPEVLREDQNQRIKWIRVQDGDELATGHNAFAVPNQKLVTLPNGFEVIALNRDPKSGVIIFGVPA